MPSSNDKIGNLEVDNLTDVGVMNDRMRRIGNLLAELAGGSVTNNTTNVNGVGSITQITLTVPGILAVESDVAPALTLPVPFSPSKAVLLLKQAPTPTPVTVQLFVNGTMWGPAMTTSGTYLLTDVSGVGTIAKDVLIRLDITAVGAALSGVTFPGADLTLELR